ncbi:hypothetical protein [Haloferula sp.]|uniref:hypothetical protein n=1 Tax=Haloferula sp. TaxID=2497595 RepID=UPI00329AAC67
MPNKLKLTCVIVIAGICLYLSQAFLWEPTSTGQGSAEPKSKAAGTDPSIPGSTPSNHSTPGNSPEVTVDTTNTDKRFTRFTDGTIHFAQSFATSRKLHKAPDPRVDLELVTQLLDDYRLVYKENPVGTDNAEIVAQLLGKNSKKIFFIDPALSAINANGELLDRWGSPYVFHPLRSDLMDVRSIGPDRTLWTDDDMSLDLADEEKAMLLHSAD